MNLKRASLLILIFLTSLSCFAQLMVTNKKAANSFPLATNGTLATILFDTKEEPVVKLAATALGADIKSITGRLPEIDSSKKISSLLLVIGTIGKNAMIDELAERGKLDVKKLQGQWECYSISIVTAPFPGCKQALVIAGSDARGTAFGVFELSKKMGVDPFYWWADVKPFRKNAIIVRGQFTSKPPSVKYRGIFLNDEDWGLQPWAANTFEKETGDIGPKTYARIFELLLRLKANLLWPAMHPSTKAFFHYKGNPKVASEYSIIIGSSHAEPMLRNNVDEWNEKTMGPFNYLTNRDRVYDYWKERVKQSRDIKAMYSMGMRGVHDSGMEGVKSSKEAVPLLQQIIKEQRGLLAEHISKDTASVPQLFTAYKEVLDVYDNGLRLPDDIILAWPDDNYGYIQRLNSNKENARSGGSGIYYHASYWGRPHDYLWLPSTNPYLVQEEMSKAWLTGSKTLWVLNVGDLKSIEYNTEQFLDMAYNIQPFLKTGCVKTHLFSWASAKFGAPNAGEISTLMLRYFRLGFERRPEFMGWSQTEPTTAVKVTAYNHFAYGDEAQKRIDAYRELRHSVMLLKTRIPKERKDAFFQLVDYPVSGAAFMNEKFLFLDKAMLYAKQGRHYAEGYIARSKAAYDSIIQLTNYYNNTLANGKWKGIMSMKPRALPVFAEPGADLQRSVATGSWNLAVEGIDSVGDKPNSLPLFDDLNQQRYFIDVFLTTPASVQWSCTSSVDWIRISKKEGRLNSSNSEERLYVEIDWKKLKQDNGEGSLVFKAGGEKRTVNIVAIRRRATIPSSYSGFIENNGMINIHAFHAPAIANTANIQWKIIDGPGYAAKVVQSSLPLQNEKIDTNRVAASSYLEYRFYNFTEAAATVTVFALPTHPLHNAYRVRYGVAVDGGAVQVVDMKTFGRSEEWKQNVLRNRAERTLTFPVLKSGRHTLRIYAIDGGVILDEIRIGIGKRSTAYSLQEETLLN